MNPWRYLDKISDLETLFFNFHHLLNEYRPHQARESLILMMQEQLEKARTETEAIMRQKENLERVIEALGGVGGIEEEALPVEKPVEDEKAEAMEVWDVLEREFGG